MDDRPNHTEHHQYSHPLVAELAWIIGSEPLMQSKVPGNPSHCLSGDWYAEQLRLHSDWLLDLDKNPEALLSFMPDKMLLGKRFERLVIFWFDQSPYFELVISNHSIVENGRTLGEIDLVVREIASNEVFHIEVACKFYLSSLNSSKWDSWIGPNGNDNLGLKMDKLKKQLNMFNTSQGTDIMLDLSIPKPDPSLMIKGYFFHHFSHLFQHKSPTLCNTNYCSGWFSKLSEAHIFPGESGLWIELQKDSWLSTIHNSAGREVFTGAVLLEFINTHFKNEKRAILLARVEVREHVLLEVDRGFIVADNWPLSN